ncbi:glycoside hydrolase family 3 protein [bacterium]|nr:glycoside hydrolase family 3 protein [bacterium]
MDLKSKLYQMFILGVDDKNTYKALEHGLSGVIFFTKDIISIQRFKFLTKDLKKHSKIPPFLSIDQEGGRVERTENIHNGKKYLSAKYAFENGMTYLEEQTENIAKELKDYGINLNFAPCTDVNSNPNNPIIGERAFSDNPEEVVKGAKIVIKTYRKNGIIPCIKHFPGHGDTEKDSHLELPVLNQTLEEMENIHIKPFKKLIEKEDIEMIMVAHLQAECFGKETPTSLNKNCIDYIRNNLNYNGVLISDDMFMKAISENYGFEKACLMGINAGLNMFIYRDANDEIITMIENIYKKALNDKTLQDKIEISYKKITNLKEKNKLFKDNIN